MSEQQENKIKKRPELDDNPLQEHPHQLQFHSEIITALISSKKHKIKFTFTKPCEPYFIGKEIEAAEVGQ